MYHILTQTQGGGVFIQSDDSYMPFSSTTIIENCKIYRNAAYGGDAIAQMDGKLVVKNTDIYDNLNGGAIYIHDGLSTSTTIDFCRIRNNRNLRIEDAMTKFAGAGGITAYPGGGVGPHGILIKDTTITGNYVANSGIEAAGGLSISGSTVTLVGNTLIHENKVLDWHGYSAGGGKRMQGDNVMLLTGVLYVKLPLVPGHWLPNGECRVIRKAYPGSPPPDYTASFDACSLTPDPASGTATIAKSQCTGPNAHTCSDPQACQPRAFMQACDWKSDNTLLGQKIYTMPPGLPVDLNFPYQCAAGMLGSPDAQYQTSALCKSPCPDGFHCPTIATIEALPCPKGHRCPKGSSTALKCEEGTFQDEPMMSTCKPCPPGHACKAGAVAAERCLPGAKVSADKGLCEPCASGEYQDAAEQSSCKPCAAGTSCTKGSDQQTPCAPGTITSTTRQSTMNILRKFKF